MKFLKREWLTITVVIIAIIIGILVFIVWLAEDVGAQEGRIALVDMGGHSQWLMNYCDKRCTLFDIERYGGYTQALDAAKQDHTIIAFPYLLEHPAPDLLAALDKRVIVGSGRVGTTVHPEVYSRATVVTTLNFYGRCHPHFDQRPEKRVIGCASSQECYTSLAVLTYALGRDRLFKLDPRAKVYDVPECGE